MAKRASDRYTTAQEIAEDLQHFLSDHGLDRQSDSSVVHANTAIMSVPDTFVPRIVPKSVRPFEEEDADGFLQLLPGPRDRHGLPDCIRFWKNRVEEKDPDKTFEVAVIYGPSGCGKTSLVKAGLLPRLDRHVAAIYLEATPASTEARLLSCMRRCCSTMPEDIGLDGALVALRRGDHLPVGRTKILIVLDQFEQWLHGRTSKDHRSLLRALRQCDGRRVQCILLVRDDFWLAIARFMRELELPIVEGQNSLLVDLFNAEHARKVLIAFGCAFGRLPQDRRELSKEQSAFLNRAISELAQDGKIVCVRLALFAEMLKDQPWTRATLRHLGGMEGVGVTFLEATFAAQTSPPHHRLHEKAARAVLRSLLPEEGQDMKCAMRPYGKLLEASGYPRRSEAFTELIRILDSDLRLITPVDADGKQIEESDLPTADPTQRYYQLTHDFLVPALREWLTRKQKETRQGRAELCLAECARRWHSKPTRRHLPEWYEFIKIRLHTDKRRWTPTEREMMSRAGWFYGIRLSVILLLLLATLLVAMAVQRTVEQNRKASRAEALVTGLLKSDAGQVPGFISEIDAQLRWALPRLQAEYREAAHGTPEKLRAGLALLPVDPGKLEYLSEQLLVVPPSQFLVVRDILRPHASKLRARLWETALNARELPQRRFQAAAALAQYDTEGKHWDEINRFVADYLVRVLPSYLGPWRDALQPISQKLIVPLEATFRDVDQSEHVRFDAADTLGAYAEAPKLLIELLADAEEFQFSPIFSAIIPHKDRVIEAGRAIISESLPAGTSEPEKEHFARRQANLAIALMRLGETEPLWSLLRHSSDPRARSNLVHWIGPRGGDLSAIISQFHSEENASTRRALVLSLGAFEISMFDESAKQCLVEELKAIYETESDAGLRAAAEWLLKKWGEAAHLAAVDQRLQSVERPRTPRAENPHEWYVTRQGHTMVVLSAGKVRMGSPHTEPFRDIDEAIHERRVERQFAIAAKEVTRAQFGRFRPELSDVEKRAGDKYTKTADSPQNFITWYEAAAYSNWLSEQEGIPETQWCYVPNADGQFAAGMVTKEDCLERVGYRLPTEAEWEFACRAGARTSRYYGHSPSLLPEYAWYEANSEYRSWPVASLKPNDYGLFDMLGNVYEWCHGRYDQHPKDSDDVLLSEATDGIFDTDERALRGGGFRYWGHGVRSAYRGRGAPDFRYSNFGFRVARTEPAPQLESE